LDKTACPGQKNTNFSPFGTKNSIFPLSGQKTQETLEKRLSQEMLEKQLFVHHINCCWDLTKNFFSVFRKKLAIPFRFSFSVNKILAKFPFSVIFKLNFVQPCSQYIVPLLCSPVGACANISQSVKKPNSQFPIPNPNLDWAALANMPSNCIVLSLLAYIDIKTNKLTASNRNQ
jgi:hypothetical protein